MSEQNIALVHRWFAEVWNKGNEEVIDELFAQDGLAHGLGPQPIRGPAEFKQMHRAFLASFSEIRAEVNDVIAVGDMVSLRATISMKHNTTGKTGNISGGGFMRIEEGKIAEAWNAWDFIGFFAQTGALPEDVMERCFSGGILK